METIHKTRSISTVTGVFATRVDAESAYLTLLNLGYDPSEITLIMSQDTCDKLYAQSSSKIYQGPAGEKIRRLQVSRISEALDVYGRFVAIPGLALVVAGNMKAGGFRALASSVLSDDYAAYFQSRIRDGEILMDFGLHTFKEKKLIMGMLENYGGDPLVRRVKSAA